MSIVFEKISHPFYKVIFKNVPTNYFSLALFGYYGEINIDLYEKEFEKFKEIIKTPDPEYNKSKNKIFKKEEGVPENAFLYSFSENFLDYFDLEKEINLYEFVIETITDENYLYENNFILSYLSYYFSFGIEYYNSDRDLLENISSNKYIHKNSEIKVKYYVGAKFRIYPIVKSKNNGDLYRDYEYLDR